MLFGRVLPAQRPRRGRSGGYSRPSRSSATSSRPFFSVTYGAGGATREGTLETTKAIRDQYGVEADGAISAAWEARPARPLREIVDRIASSGIENILALAWRSATVASRDFVQPEGGLGSAAELASLISDTHSELGNRRGPASRRLHPEASRPGGGSRLPEDEGGERRHPS